MKRDQKAAVIDRVAEQIRESNAIFAVDYRGLTVKEADDLRGRLLEAGTTFRVVKNTLTERAADKAGAEDLKELLAGPTALALVRGDAALAAKALATFRRETQRLEWKGGVLDGKRMSPEEVESISRLPAREALIGQFAAVVASPLTGLVRGLGSMVGGLAVALGQIERQRRESEGAPAGAEA